MTYTIGEDMALGVLDLAALAGHQNFVPNLSNLADACENFVHISNLELNLLHHTVAS